MQNLRILRSRHAAALRLRVLDIIEDLRGDPLAWCQNRNAWRVTHDELTADLAYGFTQRQALLRCVERLLRTRSHLRVDVLLAEQALAVRMVASLDFGQRAHETLDLLDAIADGEVGEDVADVAELDLNIVFIPQDVIDLDARESDVQRMNTKLRGIEIEDGISVA